MTDAADTNLGNFTLVSNETENYCRLKVNITMKNSEK